MTNPVRILVTPLLTLFTLLLISCTTSASLASPIATVIEKVQTENGTTWVLSYTLNTTAERLVFVRNPDSSRATRWQPEDSDIEIAYNITEQQEIVRSRTGKPISKVSFILTPTYKHLGKDYAPFSPFSDSGNAFHSGRLFVCANLCTDEDKEWPITLKVPNDEHIVLNGKVVKDSVTWVDKNNGRQVYVGKQQPVITNSAVALIDPALPKSIQASLKYDMPKIMAYFSRSLHPLAAEKPMLLASYAMVDGHSSQGGTLPNQIFMHWNKNNLDKHTENSDFANKTLWFFAHEAAHLYQPGSTDGVSENREQSWLHEGSADYFAATAMNYLYKDANSYIQRRIRHAFENCTQGLTQSTLANAYKKGRFNLYYSCGMIIHRAIDNVVQQKTSGKESLFTVWKQLQKAVSRGMPPGTATFLALLEPYNAPELINAIKNATSDDDKKAIQGIQALYKMHWQ